MLTQKEHSPIVQTDSILQAPKLHGEFLKNKK